MAETLIENEKHWHALRLQNVGGSEVAALFDECSYLTRLELYLIKRSEISGAIEDNNRMFWGRHLEDGIALGIQTKTGCVIHNPKAYFTCDDTPGMGCTPDRIMAFENGTKRLLQIKTVDGLTFRNDWPDGQPPLPYLLQLQQEMACTGFAAGVLAVLVGGNDLKMFDYEAHAGAQAKIKLAITDFWTMVRENRQPPAVAEDYDVLREFYPNASLPPINLSGDNEMPSLCATAIDAGARRKDAEKEEKQAKASILQKIGNASGAYCSGFNVRKNVVHKTEFTMKATSYPTLSIKEISI